MTNSSDFSQDEIIKRWQSKALQLDPDGDIERYFSTQYSCWELLKTASFLPKRFIAVVFADVDECSKCNREFNWQKHEQIAFLPQFETYGGERMPEDEKDLFFLDNDSLGEWVICDACMRKMLNRYFSLQYAAKAARRREKLEKEQHDQEAKQIETIIRASAKGVWLFDGKDDDGGLSLREYLIDRYVSFSTLADIKGEFFDFDNLLQRAFANRDLYLYLNENRSIEHGKSFWEEAITRFS